ncbi:MAG: TrbG/VirB9 family P-type conjugative transfer protein [Alphaproteobacteria bacterium]|nr:TrbG/VirB9 family P-type conjugative transfer protein [Alphaproteobacteria bacterium]
MVAVAPQGLLAGAADDRLVTRPFGEDQVVRIDGRLGVQATIGFAEDEQIENVAVGDSAKWQITPNKRANLLFVKPLEADARTNMTVVTDRHTYFFDLVASARAKPVYLLRFSYPEEDRLAADKAREERQLALNELEQDLLSGDPAAAPTDPAMLNFAWASKGDPGLMPSRIYDDGNSTYLIWPAKRAIPAILVENEQGVEGPVNYAVRGDTIVIGEVPRLISLRSGKAHAVLQNRRDDKGANAATAPAAPSPSAMAAQLPDVASPERN